MNDYPSFHRSGFRNEVGNTGRGKSSVDHALTLLTQDIVFGTIPPGTKLKIRELVERYDIGATPIREALSQLVASGFVDLESNKGFRIGEASEEKLKDITVTRQLIELEALRLAMEYGTADWEDEIVASFNLLDYELSRFQKNSSEWILRYEDKHHRFHRALIAACPYKKMLAYSDSLYIQMTRYRCLFVSKSMYKVTPQGDHRKLMDLVLARDPKVIDLLRNHIGRTGDCMKDLVESESCNTVN